MTSTSAQLPLRTAHPARACGARGALRVSAQPAGLGPWPRANGTLGSRPAVRWVLAAGLACIGTLTTEAAPRPADGPAVAMEEGPAWRQAGAGLAPQDAVAELSQVRERLERAREQGDAQGEWRHLAELLRQTPLVDHERTPSRLMLAEQALQAAQREGDAAASFDLIMAIETARLELQTVGAREAQLTRAQTLATELGDPVRTGRVMRLRGLAAFYQGQPGEALVQFQRALPRMTDPRDRADLLSLMARTALAQPGRAGADLAESHLQSLKTATARELSPISVDTLLLHAEVQRRSGRAADALIRAQQAVALARLQGASTPLARSQLALAQAHLDAGHTAQALAHLHGTVAAALSPSDQLLLLATQARALAAQGDQGARRQLMQGQRLIEQTPHLQRLVVLQFHESASHTLAALGDTQAAFDALMQAMTLRTALADASREQLAQARIDTARGAAARVAESLQEHGLAASAAVLVLVLAGLGGATLWRIRQRRQWLRRGAELEAANAALQAVNAARKRHLATACHDLHQPARVIEQVADTALAQLERAEALVPAPFLPVQRCTRTLQDMLEGLLDLSVLEQGRYVAHLQAVPLGDLLGEVDLQYRRAALDKGLTWQVGSCTAHVRADRHLLRRVLFNLASNAVRHSSQGGIQILAIATDDQVWVDVADTGPGLPASQINEATGANDGPPGSALAQGAGLAIVREACRLMAHDVAVPLSSPLGSVVRVTMPRCPAPNGTPMNPDHLFSGQTVALVESDRARRQALVETLGAAGLQAASFVSLAALRDASGAYPPAGPDLLVVDLGADALVPAASALKSWLEDCPTWRSPVLVLTADLGMEGLLRATELGFHLACKPLSPTRLVELLHDMLTPPHPVTTARDGMSRSRHDEVMAP